MAKEYSHFVPAAPINPNYEDDKTYILIESLDQLKESFKKGMVVAWDTETTGLNPEHSDIVGFSYTLDGKTGYYCPVKHFDLALGKPALDLFYSFLKESKMSLLYNARFDIRIMEYSGYDMSFMYPKDPDGQYRPRFYDVMNQVWLADTNIPLPSLKVSTLHFLGFQPPKFMETLGSEQNFQYVSAKEAYRYACFTADTLVQTKHGLKSIKELQPGKDLIKTSTGYHRLIDVLPQGVHPTIKVIPPFGVPFTCTPDHKFAVEQDDKLCWIKAEDLAYFPFHSIYHGGVSLNDVTEIAYPDFRYTHNVCKIENGEEQEVYDLSIEGEHNFFLQCGLIAHNCLDAINTFNLFKATFRFVAEAKMVSYLDNSCTYIIGQLEKTPLNMNTDYLIALRDKVYDHVLEIEQEIYSLAGHQFKIGSNRELTQVFIEQGIDTGEKTKAGDMKTGKELLSNYLRNHPECVILDKIIEYKEQFKFYNSYLKTLVDIAKQQETVPPRFSYKLQAVPCLTKNNLVLVKNKGLVSIAAVMEQDYIWTQYGYKRVLWNNSHKSKDLYHITFSNSFYIEGTAHHPVLVNKGTSTDIKLEWAILSDLKIGEHVVINHHTPSLEKTEEGTFTQFIEYLGFLTSPLLLKDVAYIPEYMNTLKDFKQNSNQTFRILTEGIMNDSDAVMRLVSCSKPGDWVSYIKGLLYAVFETQIAQNWNTDFPNTRVFRIYSENSSMMIFLMGLFSFLGIQSTQHYNGVNFYLEFTSDQSLVLFKQLIVTEVNSPYLTNLFANILDYYIEYEDTEVAEITKLPDEDTVYDIEVEGVHEYVANGIVTHNTGRLACITGDTLIPTILGYIPIEELPLYEDGNEVYVDSCTTARFHTLYMGVKPVVEIHLDNGKKIKATLDHRFMNAKTEWVYVNDLKVGDSLLSVIDNNITSTKIINMIPLKEPEPVWTLTVDHINHQYLSNSLISHNCGKDGKNTYFSPVNLQCLEENTLVKTDRGNIPIKNVTKDDLVWTGTRFVPCQPLGHKRKHCYKIKTLWGEIEASLEHRFFTLNHKTWEFEWHTLGECILYHYPLVRDPQEPGISFDELYNYRDYNNTKRNKKRELSLEEYKEYLDLYKDCKFDVITESPKEFWNPKMDVPHLIKTVYDLYVPEYNQFTANGYIVHNSLPKPKSVKCYGRKATQEEKDQHLDVLGWMFSPDHPEWSPGQVVEGMKQSLNVRSAFLPEHPENGDYIVSIDMSAEELKIVTNLFKEENWARVILNGGDLHHANSDAIFGKENYTKETRKKAKCVAGNCTVQTSLGKQCIKDLCKERILGEPIPINTFVYTPEKFCKAKYFIYNGVQKTLLFTFTDNSTLEVTPDHIVKSNAKLVKAETLKIGDVIDTVVINKNLPNNKQIVSIKESESEVFDLTIENKTHLFYANGFVVHNCAAFGLLYGQEYRGFQQKFPEMTLDEAKEFMAKFKQAIPHIIHGQDRMVRESKRTGSCYSGLGRPRRVKYYMASPDIKANAFGVRTVKNNPIQSTAADVLKIEFIRLWQNVFMKYPEIKFVCTIHDEINFSVPRKLADEVIPILVNCMTVEMKDWLVPLTCSLSAGPALGNQYAMKYNFTTKEFEPDWEEDTRKPDQPKEPEKETIDFQDPDAEKDLMDLLDEDDEKITANKKEEEENIESIDSKMFEF